MIVITKQDKRITIKGHANYAPIGQDIVCASVSTLVQVMIASIEAMTHDTFEYDMQPGLVDIKFRSLSEKAQLLVKSFFIGVQMIADEYPYNVKIDQALKS